jgi:ABC-type uncharacterized transport system auxiliary subunit
VAVLAGCGGSMPKTNYYALNLPAPAPHPREPGPYSVAVMPFQAPDHLDRDRILYRPSAVEVGFYEYHRWAERPPAAITTALVERLRAARIFASVSPFDGRSKPDFLLRGRVNRLEEVDAPGEVTVQVQLSAELVAAKDNQTVWTGAASHSGAVTQGEVKAVVAELSRGVDACLAQIVTSLEGFARSLPRAPAAASAESR